jgi:mRNA interferase RelE/StbE
LSDAFRIFETDQFRKSLKKLRIPESGRIYQKLTGPVYRQLRVNPFYGKNIKKLKDWTPEMRRYRVGNLRLFYTIDESEKIVSIIIIESRDKAYN